MTVDAAADPATAARAIVRSVARAAPDILLHSAAAAPYVSLANVAAEHDGAPLLLLSDLADHTRSLAVDPRAPLLFDSTGEREDPLAAERVTVQERLTRSNDRRHRRRDLARHAVAAMSTDFKDFKLYRPAVECPHLVAGFGRIHWLAASVLLVELAPALIAREADIILHMSDEHRDAIDAYAEGLLGLAGDGWRPGRSRRLRSQARPPSRPPALRAAGDRCRERARRAREPGSLGRSRLGIAS
jgi:hypothetical protein